MRDFRNTRFTWRVGTDRQVLVTEEANGRAVWDIDLRSPDAVPITWSHSDENKAKEYAVDYARKKQEELVISLAKLVETWESA